MAEITRVWDGEAWQMSPDDKAILGNAVCLACGGKPSA